MTPAELAEQRRQFEAMRRQRGRKARVREEARGKAARLWDMTKPAEAAILTFAQGREGREFDSCGIAW